MELLLSALVLAAMLAGWLFVRHIRNATAESLREVAARHSWRYMEENPALVRAYEGTPFGDGGNRRALSVVYGEHRERRMHAFEYVYDVGAGSSREHVYHTVAAVDLPAECPTLEVTQEHAGHKLLGLVGVHDLELESEEFNRTFRVRSAGDDRADKFAYDVLHPRTMEWLLEDPRAKAFSFRFEDATLICWEQGALDVGRLLAMLDYSCDLLDRVPKHVLPTERR